MVTAASARPGLWHEARFHSRGFGEAPPGGGGLSSLSIISSPTSVSSSLEDTGVRPPKHALGSGVRAARGGVGFQGAAGHRGAFNECAALGHGEL